MKHCFLKRLVKVPGTKGTGWRFVASLLVLSLALLEPVPFVFADSITESAGAEATRFEDSLEREARDQKKHSDHLTQVIEDETSSKKSQAKKTYDGPIFRMNNIRITGNESIPSSELEPIVGTLLNRDVNMDEVQDVVAEIKEYYRKNGYVSTYVHVPPQQLKNGIIEIRVVEGELSDVTVEGNRYFSDGVIIKRIQLDSNKKVDYDGLRKSLKRLNKHRDIQAKAILKPGMKPGTTAVQLQVEDKFPLHLGADVNNLGTDNTGNIRTGVSLSHTNLTGNMDTLSGRFQIGSGATAVGANYEAPINSIDTKVGFAYTRATVDVGGSFKALDLEGTATTYGAYVIQPLLEAENFEASAQVGFDWKSIHNKILGRDSSNDELRILKMGVTGNQTDKAGKTFFQQFFLQGFDRFLGASHKSDSHSTRVGSGGQFFISRTNIQRYFTLPGAMTLALKFAMQLTEDKLAPAEQFRLGGAYSVRGFSEGEYLGDYGTRLQTELHVPTYIFPEDWSLPWTDEPLREQIKAVGFFDFGGASLRGPLPGEREHRFLAGIGGGLRMRLYKRVYARLEWATSVGAGRNDGADSAFYFGVSTELF